MRVHLQQIRWCLLYATILFGAAGIYNLTGGGNVQEVAHGLFLGVVFFVLAAIVWNYYKAILLYLNNESSSNLDRAMERQLIFWVASSLFASLYAVIHFVFR